MPNGNGQGQTQGRARRRFARDGEVAVVVLPRGDHAGLSEAQPSISVSSPPVNRLAVAEAARDSERAARLRAERALAEAQSALRSLQTQVRHTEMNQAEVVENARRAVADRDALEASLASERQAREAAEQALAKVLTKVVVRRQRPEREPAAADAAGSPPVPRTKKPARAGSRAPDPKPVKWWIKPRA